MPYSINTQPFPALDALLLPTPIPALQVGLDVGAAFATCGANTKIIDATNATATQHRVAACKKVRACAEHFED